MRGIAGWVVLAALTLTACDEGPTGPEGGAPATLTVDATADWAFVTLGEEASEVEVGDATSSTAWDIAFFATDVMLNGGAAGAGEVEGHCLCQNAGATDADVIGMTAEGELGDFEAVTSADIPVDAESWLGDELVPAIDGWWTYNPATHVVSANADAVFKVRTHTGASYAKLRVTGIEDPTQAHAGQVTLEFAVQESAGTAMGATETLTVDVSAGPVYVDLVAGAVSDETSWDLRLDGYTIRVNGGVSGAGAAGAIAAGAEFDAIADASDMGTHYRGDAFGGVFATADASRRWYRYNLEGTHLIYPTYNVYLVRTGEAVYKVQLISYYSGTGESRHITFRYARLDG